jgi:hypothetical protein
LVRNGIPRRIISYNGGVGDDLLCGTVAYELRRRGERRIWVATHYPELFRGNPDLCAIPLADWRYGTLGTLIGVPTTALWYTTYDPSEDRDPEPLRHFAAMMCEKAGIKGRVAIRPYLYLTDGEKATGRLAPDQIVVQSSAGGAGTPLLNKEWYVERMQAVVDRFRERYTVVQLGVGKDSKLRGVVDLTGRTSLREVAAVLCQARAFVGLAGGLMHLARAVNCPAAIVYGGRERAEISGYVCNENITRWPPCSPCWRRNRCDHDRVCMQDISAEEVIEATERVLNRGGETLAVEYVDI